MPSRLLRWCVPLALAALAAGCGIKGPLYLPPEDPEAASVPEQRPDFIIFSHGEDGQVRTSGQGR
ncbi:MAG: lipoprotein [Succinivibrionaceae bacterium]|nr:lipoprotein [Succinivibrionaceae bacterium]